MGQVKGTTNPIPIVNLLIWATLIAGTVIGVRLQIPGSTQEINLTLFDMVLPASLLFMILTRRIMMARLPLMLLAVLAVVPVLVLGHALLAWRYGTWTPIPQLAGAVQTAGLIRETVKLVTVQLELAALLVLFTAPELRAPPLWLLALLTAMLGGNMVYERVQLSMIEHIPYFANIEANTLVGVMVLAIFVMGLCPVKPSGCGPAAAEVTHPGSKFAHRHTINEWSEPNRMIVMGLVIVITLVMVVCVRKIYIGVSIIILVALAISLFRDARPQWDIVRLKWVILFLIMMGVILFGVYFVMTNLFYPGGNPLGLLVENVNHSSEERLDLQIVAWRLGLLAFPFGIGIGQFGALVPRIPEIADLGTQFNVAFVHNTPLALFSEMGILGIALCAGLFSLIALACRGGDWASRLSRLAYFILPMIVNDTHGLRMTILLLGYFIMAASVGGRSARADTQCDPVSRVA